MLSDTPASSLAADSVEIELIMVSICSVTSVRSRLILGRKLRTMPIGKYSMPFETVEVVAVERTMGICLPTWMRAWRSLRHEHRRTGQNLGVTGFGKCVDAAFEGGKVGEGVARE